MSLSKVKQKIQDNRIQSGMTTTQYMRRMAIDISISLGTLYRILGDPRSARYNSLKKVVEYVGLTMDEVQSDLNSKTAME